MIDIPMNTRPAVGLNELAEGLGNQRQGQAAVPPRPATYQVPPPGPVTAGQIPPSRSASAGVVQRQNNTGAGGVILRKGQKVSLSSMSQNLDRIAVCLSWDVADRNVYDLDSECFMLGQDGKVIGDDWFVFYNHTSSPDGSVRHSGDCLDGSLDGDDEVINVVLNQVNPQVKRLVFVVTINEAKEKGLAFAGVQNAGVRIVDLENNRELCRFNLTDYYSNVISMVVAEVYRHNNEWKMTAVGSGLDAGLLDLCIRYGVNVAG